MIGLSNLIKSSFSSIRLDLYACTSMQKSLWILELLYCKREIIYKVNNHLKVKHSNYLLLFVDLLLKFWSFIYTVLWNRLMICHHWIFSFHGLLYVWLQTLIYAKVIFQGSHYYFGRHYNWCISNCLKFFSIDLAPRMVNNETFGMNLKGVNIEKIMWLKRKIDMVLQLWNWSGSWDRKKTNKTPNLI